MRRNWNLLARISAGEVEVNHGNLAMLQARLSAIAKVRRVFRKPVIPVMLPKVAAGMVC
jgi:hypothetical protein